MYNFDLSCYFFEKDEQLKDNEIVIWGVVHIVKVCYFYINEKQFRRERQMAKSDSKGGDVRWDLQ